MGWWLLNKTAQAETRILGRMSDGSDRQQVDTTVWLCRVRDDDGREGQLWFDHDPTTAEIFAGMPAVATTLVPTRKADLARHLRELYGDWRRWHDTHAEAVARAAPALVITALLNQRNSAWQDYVDGIQAWRVAT